MKALAINSAVTRLSISCKNDDHIVSAIYDIGMKQSETLLSAIEYVMEKANVKVEELNYSALS
ncbi:MAG: tRNA (adenosine(37)-N6)-threonylcarbamoyltransferase complex dimerization subunit type 1 TsaB, partial [Treponema sp.]|nr:tRNA (adenosine(37)-N6)-threonylcarbamoyltransferase complex dimerization subunit type 1 TsaB [Treponema sp.]